LLQRSIFVCAWQEQRFNLFKSPKAYQHAEDECLKINLADSNIWRPWENEATPPHWSKVWACEQGSTKNGPFPKIHGARRGVLQIFVGKII